MAHGRCPARLDGRGLMQARGPQPDLPEIHPRGVRGEARPAGSGAFQDRIPDADPNVLPPLAKANIRRNPPSQGRKSGRRSMYRVDRLTVRGFKSIRALEDFELGPLNVMIGQNGAGKTNLMDLFQLLRNLAEQRLQEFVAERDGPDALLFGGREQTDQIDIQCHLGRDGYLCSLSPAGKHLAFLRELVHSPGAATHSLGSGHYESNLVQAETDDAVLSAHSLRKAMSSWRLYHFHNTSSRSQLRQAQALRDNLLTSTV